MTNLHSTRFVPPRWLQITCCLAPLAAFLFLSIGVALGAVVSTLPLVVLTGLCWKVIAFVLQIPSPRLSAVQIGKWFKLAKWYGTDRELPDTEVKADAVA